MLQWHEPRPHRLTTLYCPSLPKHVVIVLHIVVGQQVVDLQAGNTQVGYPEGCSGLISGLLLSPCKAPCATVGLCSWPHLYQPALKNWPQDSKHGCWPTLVLVADTALSIRSVSLPLLLPLLLPLPMGRTSASSASLSTLQSLHWKLQQ